MGSENFSIINPHGGRLINRVADGSRREELKSRADVLYKIKISDRYVSDCEMIAIGGFSPLTGFMEREVVEVVLEKMELPSGVLWSIPIVLPVDKLSWMDVNLGDEIALIDRYDRLIAVMSVSDKFKLDLEYFCRKVFKTVDLSHPGVRAVKESGDMFLAGDIELVNRPIREGIDGRYFLDPVQTRAEIERRGWRTVVAFQTRNPIHRAHEYLIKCALESLDGVLIHPLVGETKPDDVPADVRMRCYEVLIENYFNRERTILSVLPTAMRYAGPREAIHHMIMRKNYGCTHMIIGRDHAGVGNYYGAYEAQELVDMLVDKLEIRPVKFEHSFYCRRCENMASGKTCPHPSDEHIHLSGTKLREMLKEGRRPPKEFSRPEVIDILIEWATSVDVNRGIKT
jgi:sulfate adenylyltransferase